MLLGLLAILCSCGQARSGVAPLYDLVIANGRVMDPASGLDTVRNLGLVGGTIRAVTAQPLRGRDTLHARGMANDPNFKGRLARQEVSRPEVVGWMVTSARNGQPRQLL